MAAERTTNLAPTRSPRTCPLPATSTGHAATAPTCSPRTCPPFAARTGHNATMSTRGPQDWTCPPVEGALKVRPERFRG